MKNYKIFILNKLIDSYESSVLYRRESKRDNKIYFKFTEKNIKDYFNELDYEFKEEIDIACNQMESENFIKIYKKSGLNNHLIDKVQLNLDNLLKDFSKEEYTFEYNIIKNYTYVYFKGNITLKIKETFINAKDFIGGIAISSKDIENIEYIKVNGDKLITIENLTSFNTYEDKNAGIIYLGGYHNLVRQKMLIKIYENNKKIKYYHFGDIDVGGFKILVHLISKTKIKFTPLNMDEDTLIKNIKYAKDLTQNDIKEINRLLDKEEFREYYNILTFILKKGKKLEQEIVSI